MIEERSQTIQKQLSKIQIQELEEQILRIEIEIESLCIKRDFLKEQLVKITKKEAMK